jgi:predicted NBD/HSP70 family sugar kinase
VLRRANARVLLDLLWQQPPGETVTANELIAASSLTRATVLGVCDELVDQGWLAEVAHESGAGAPARGRPARRFRFRQDAGYVVGIDVGFRHASCAVADLHGRVAARREVDFGADSTRAGARVAQIRRLVDETLAAAAVREAAVLAACFGVAAPVDSRGASPSDEAFWVTVRIDPAQILAAHAGWDCLIENDANLAALAEREGLPADASYVALLVGERFGAGIVDNGRLLHGHAGGSGEMHYLHLVEGVGAPDALARLARRWATEALDAGAVTTLASAPRDAGAPSAEAVLAAAQAGDPVAVDIADRMADRLARVVATLASLANPEVVVLGGSITPELGPVLDGLGDRLTALTPVPPRVVPSTHGGDIVLVGAVRAALDHVVERAVGLRLPAAP